MTKSKKILIGILAAFAFYPEVKADFGAADLGSSGNEYSAFDAWCAKRGKDCLVKFSAEGIVVNNGQAVPYENVVTYTYEVDDKMFGDLHIFDIVYSKKNGSRGVGRIIFGNKKVALNFLSSLKEYTRKDRRGDPRCSNNLSYYKGNCIDTKEALLLKREDRERQLDRLGEAADFLQEQRRLDIQELDAGTPDAVIQMNQYNQNNNFEY